MPNKGDTAFMMIATVLVLLMTIPGLALFYGGLVRSKNMLSVLMQVFAIVSLVSIIWVVYGYSLAFTNGGALNAFIGGFDKVFLNGVDAGIDGRDILERRGHPRVRLRRLPDDVRLHHAGADRRRLRRAHTFSALMLFVVLWVTFVYCPIAHMVWYWAGPDADRGSRQGGRRRSGDAKKLPRPHWRRYRPMRACSIQLGRARFCRRHRGAHQRRHRRPRRRAHDRQARRLRPRGHGAALADLTMVGAALLWVGWFGFNAGSNLEANGTAALAMMNTFVATAAAGAGLDARGVGWQGQAVAARPRLGCRRGPGRGHAGLRVRRADGLDRARPGRRRRLLHLLHDRSRTRSGYDDSLDVFGVHCIGGIIGAIGTGILVAP